MKVDFKGKNFFDFLALFFLFGFLLSYFPKEVLSIHPATGGDTGSHFFPLVTLVQEALPNFQVKSWNPGNLGGEPHLVHYFPLPYLVMAFFSLFVPLGMAFNLGTLFPILLFPLSVYWCLRWLKLPFPIPILGTYASLAALLNESFSMWGGNVLSLLAGQFAHLYALCFFLLGVGYLYKELSQSRWPFMATLLFAGVQLSHSYVALYLFIVYAVFLLFLRHLTFQKRLMYLLSSSVVTVLLAAWFILPMLDNAPWTTPFSLVWYSTKIIDEALPMIFRPYVVAFLVGLIGLFFTFKKRKINSDVYFSMTLFFFIILFSIGFYYIFPKLGLVDVRAFPQAQIALVILAAIPVGYILRFVFKQYARVTLMVGFMALILMGVHVQIKNLNYWMKWNYSGWEGKAPFEQIKKLKADAQGTLSDPRIVYENSESYTPMGTMRVFEMLPYFMGRGTLESVYMQASILAPMSFYIQALVSDRPSCPYREFPCPRINLSQALPYLKLMGAGELILSTTVAKDQAKLIPELEPQTDYGLFQRFKIANSANLVEVVNSKLEIIPEQDYKKFFFQWFEKFTEGKNLLIVDRNLSVEDKDKLNSGVIYDENQVCNPTLEANFQKIKLTTNCPGKLHQIRFAFHPTFKSTTGEKTYLLSPGFIGVIPKGETVELEFGKSLLWTVSPLISWLSLFFLFGARSYFWTRKVFGVRV